MHAPPTMKFPVERETSWIQGDQQIKGVVMQIKKDSYQIQNFQC